MKKYARLIMMITAVITLTIGCSKNESTAAPAETKGYVSGKITDAAGNPLPNVSVIIEHATWYNSYLGTTTDANGNYKIQIPTQPAGSWTAKAKFEKSLFGKEYRFDLHSSNNDPFNVTEAVSRNFIWKLSGEKPDGGYYGAHIDFYQLGIDVNLSDVRAQLIPLEAKLADGTNAIGIEKNIEDVAGTFMIKDIPIGKYKIKLLYSGKSFLLRNRTGDENATAEKIVVFGKAGFLAETEYNIEFWITE